MATTRPLRTFVRKKPHVGGSGSVHTKTPTSKKGWALLCRTALVLASKTKFACPEEQETPVHHHVQKDQHADDEHPMFGREQTKIHRHPSLIAHCFVCQPYDGSALPSSSWRKRTYTHICRVHSAHRIAHLYQQRPIFGHIQRDPVPRPILCHHANGATQNRRA